MGLLAIGLLIVLGGGIAGWLLLSSNPRTHSVHTNSAGNAACGNESPTLLNACSRDSGRSDTNGPRDDWSTPSSPDNTTTTKPDDSAPESAPRGTSPSQEKSSSPAFGFFDIERFANYRDNVPPPTEEPADIAVDFEDRTATEWETAGFDPDGPFGGSIAYRVQVFRADTGELATGADVLAVDESSGEAWRVRVDDESVSFVLPIQAEPELKFYAWMNGLWGATAYSHSRWCWRGTRLAMDTSTSISVTIQILLVPEIPSSPECETTVTASSPGDAEYAVALLGLSYIARAGTDGQLRIPHIHDSLVDKHGHILTV